MAPDQKADLRGWEPLKGPRVGREAFQVTPFMRLARAHMASKGANILVGLALADSIFFVDPSEARGNVALALAMTMVPFTLLSPMIGPVLDRLKGGRRFIIIGANALPVAVCLLMIRELETLMLYPLAFLVLMLDKSYNVAKSAVVPSLVHSDEALVQANATLSRLSGLAVVAVIPGGIARLIGENVDAFTGAQAILAVAAAGFVIATAFSLQLPKVRVASEPTSQDERSELRGAGVLLAASAMALMRGIAGFVFLLMAFRYQEDPVFLGLVAGATGVGSFGGTFVATALRNADIPEERILQSVMGVVAGVAVFAVYLDGPAAALLLTLTVGVAASSGKLSFDSILQKDAPDSNRGRAFARFETRFQLVWVVGAFVGIIDWPNTRIGFLIIAGVAAFALVSYLTGVKAVAHGKPPPQRTKQLQRTLVTRTRRAATARAGRRKKTATIGSAAEDRPDGPGSSGDDATAVDPTIDGDAPTRVQQQPDPASGAEERAGDLPPLPSPDDELVETATGHPPPSPEPSGPLYDQDVGGGEPAGTGGGGDRDERPSPPERARPSSADTTVIIDPTKLQ